MPPHNPSSAATTPYSTPSTSPNRNSFTDVDKDVSARRDQSSNRHGQDIGFYRNVKINRGDYYDSNDSLESQDVGEYEDEASFDDDDYSQEYEEESSYDGDSQEYDDESSFDEDSQEYDNDKDYDDDDYSDEYEDDYGIEEDDLEEELKVDKVIMFEEEAKLSAKLGSLKGSFEKNSFDEKETEEDIVEEVHNEVQNDFEKYSFGNRETEEDIVEEVHNEVQNYACDIGNEAKECEQNQPKDDWQEQKCQKENVFSFYQAEDFGEANRKMGHLNVQDPLRLQEDSVLNKTIDLKNRNEEDNAPSQQIEYENTKKENVFCFYQAGSDKPAYVEEKEDTFNKKEETKDMFCFYQAGSDKLTYAEEKENTFDKKEDTKDVFCFYQAGPDKPAYAEEEEDKFDKKEETKETVEVSGRADESIAPESTKKISVFSFYQTEEDCNEGTLGHYDGPKMDAQEANEDELNKPNNSGVDQFKNRCEEEKKSKVFSFYQLEKADEPADNKFNFYQSDMRNEDELNYVDSQVNDDDHETSPSLKTPPRIMRCHQKSVFTMEDIEAEEEKNATITNKQNIFTMEDYEKLNQLKNESNVYTIDDINRHDEEAKHQEEKTDSELGKSFSYPEAYPAVNSHSERDTVEKLMLLQMHFRSSHKSLLDKYGFGYMAPMVPYATPERKGILKESKYGSDASAYADSHEATSSNNAVAAINVDRISNDSNEEIFNDDIVSLTPELLSQYLTIDECKKIGTKIITTELYQNKDTLALALNENTHIENEADSYICGTCQLPRLMKKNCHDVHFDVDEVLTAEPKLVPCPICPVLLKKVLKRKSKQDKKDQEEKEQEALVEKILEESRERASSMDDRWNEIANRPKVHQSWLQPLQSNKKVDTQIIVKETKNAKKNEKKNSKKSKKTMEASIDISRLCSKYKLEDYQEYFQNHQPAAQKTPPQRQGPTASQAPSRKKKFNFDFGDVFQFYGPQREEKVEEIDLFSYTAK